MGNVIAIWTTSQVLEKLIYEHSVAQAAHADLIARLVPEAQNDQNKRSHNLVKERAYLRTEWARQEQITALPLSQQ